MHEAHLALTAETARVVETVPVLTERRVVCALIHVLTRVAVASETRVTHTLRHSQHFSFTIIICLVHA